MASADGGETAASQAELPPTVRRELATILASAGVIESSVRIENDAGGMARIAFTMQTERLVEPRDTGILPEEPVEFYYASMDVVGVDEPLVISGRADFPRTLPHLNPVLPGRPASLCLARAGLQKIYDRYGVEGVMQRLRSWLRAAQTGGLTEDGWHPVPMASQMDVRPAWLDAARFQEMAVAAPKVSLLTGVARLSPDAAFVVVTDRTAAADKPARNSALSRAVSEIKDGALLVGIPWLFVWPANQTPIADAVFGLWPNYKAMREGLAAAGLASLLETAIGTVIANGCDCKHFPGRKTLVVIIGLWRPKPLGQEILGLSADPTARSLEIKAYTLETAVTGNLLSDDTPVRALIADPVPGPNIYRWVSGLPALRPAMLVGYGALGSDIGDHLIRGGLKDLRVLDADHLAPHNPARHRGDIRDMYRSKASIFEARARLLSAPDVLSKHQGFPENILRLSEAELAARVDGCAVIIDATADERVRGRLTQLNGQLNRQVIRTELYHGGRLGIQFVTRSDGNPDLFDLYYALCRAALENQSVADWLSAEYLEGPDTAELIFGFGCASLTTKLPGFVVAQHAAAFMPTIIRCLADGAPIGVGINALDTQFRPSGWHWLDIPPFVEFAPAVVPGWKVRIHPDVMRWLVEERMRKLPSETGGYLYGAWDLALRRITVVAASEEPPGSKATAVGIELGPKGGTPFEQRLTQATRGRVAVCGSWHSHPPGSSATLSPKDITTMAEFRRLDHPLGLPTFFLVVAENENAAHLIA